MLTLALLINQADALFWQKNIFSNILQLALISVNLNERLHWETLMNLHIAAIRRAFTFKEKFNIAADRELFRAKEIFNKNQMIKTKKKKKIELIFVGIHIR